MGGLLQSPMDTSPKKPWQSKTVWAGLLTAIAPFIPGVDLWITQNPTVFTIVIGALFSGLRMVTNGKVDVK